MISDIDMHSPNDILIILLAMSHTSIDFSIIAIGSAVGLLHSVYADIKDWYIIRHNHDVKMPIM